MTAEGESAESTPARNESWLQAPPGGTVTFLLTDVESSSRLWEERPAEMGPAIARHYEILDTCIAHAHGVRPVEQGEGDSVVGAFIRASDAAVAASEAQRQLLEELGGVFRVRMALHTGEAQLRDQGNYMGHAVIRCARLRACGHGGQVLLSGPTALLLADEMPDGLALIDLGAHRLRDLVRPESVWQLTGPGLPVEFPPLRSLDVLATNLPSPATALVGRAAELEELCRLFRAGRRMVTITGAGGVGKTRLAQQVGADLVDDFADGVWWVELAALSSVDQVVSAIAGTMGVRETPGRPLLDMVTAQVRPYRCLLILDNCEQVVDPVAEAVEVLLRWCPHVCMLATSREVLNVPGETTWRVPSLRLPTDLTADLDTVRKSEAVALFLERASWARPGFTLTADNVALVGRICRRLDGIPLALELAAARIRALPLERLGAELDQRFAVLADGSRSHLPRQQTLRASVTWSYDLLEEPERMVFRSLAPFVGGLTLEAAEHVCGGGEVDEYPIFELLTRLVNKSLVNFDEETGRYRMLEVIRDYSRSEAVAQGEWNEVRDRHLVWARDLAEGFSVRTVRPTWQLVAAIEPEVGNLFAALEWSLERGRDPAADLVPALALFHVGRQRVADAKPWCERLLEALAGVDDSTWSRTVAAVAHLYNDSGDAPFVMTTLPAARAQALQEGDHWSVVRCQAYLGVAGFVVGRPDCFDLMQEAAAAAAEHGDLPGELEARSWLAMALAVNGMPRDARPHLDRVAELGVSDTIFTPQYQTALIVSALFRGELQRADAALRRAPPSPMTAWSAVLLVMYTGDPTPLVDAATGLPDAARLSPWDAWAPLFVEAALAFTSGDTPTARRPAEQAVSVQAFGVPFFPATWLAATLALADDDVDAAAGHVQTMAATAAPHGWGQAAIGLLAAELAAERGDMSGALENAHAGLAVATAQDLVLWTADLLELLGSLHLAEPPAAARLLGAAEAIRDRTGYQQRMAHRQRRFERARAVAEVEQESWAAGRLLTPQDATAYAVTIRDQ